MISGEKVEVTGVVDGKRSVELHRIPVVQFPDLGLGHSLAAGHGRVHIQRVDLAQDLSPKAGPSRDHDRDLDLDLDLDPDQKVVHALAVDRDLGQDQRAFLGRVQEVDHVPGVGQDLGRVCHDPDPGQRVGQGVADHPVLGLGNDEHVFAGAVHCY
jgi:hypothetical protein